MTKILERAPITVEPFVDTDQNLEFAKKVNQELGYSGILQAQEEATEAQKKARTEQLIADGFNACGMQPFTEKSVKSYKQAVVEHSKRTSRKATLK